MGSLYCIGVPYIIEGVDPLYYIRAWVPGTHTLIRTVCADYNVGPQGTVCAVQSVGPQERWVPYIIEGVGSLILYKGSLRYRRGWIPYII